MQLSKFQAVAKKRSAWEAIDLGCVMARAWFFKLWLLWLIPASACLLILSLILHAYPGWVSCIVWLLKPVWERPLLYVASQQLFGEKLSLRDIVRGFFQSNKKDWLWWLTLRRFNPSRSFLMPVTVLEGLSGANRSARVNLLQRSFSGAAGWLLMSAVHIEFFIVLALLAGAALLIPSGVQLHWQSLLFEHENLLTHLYNLAWVIAASFIAPFYVCSGFSLYLQRRIDLEAWDIEIQFRQLASRLAKKGPKHSSVRATLPILAIVMCVGAASIQTPAVLAQGQIDDKLNSPFVSHDKNQADAPAGEVDSKSVAQPHTASEKAKQRAHNILSASPFFKEKLEKTLGVKPEESKKSIPDWLIRFADWLDKHGSFFSVLADLFRGLATIVEVLLWLSLGAIIVFVIWRYREWIKRAANYFRATDETEEHVIPKSLFGIVLEDEPLPEDVIVSANQLWQQGGRREAFSLLLRATLLACVAKGCKFKDGYTELECAQVVNKQCTAHEISSFGVLIEHWQLLAYAHRPCSDSVFSTLCNNYKEHWVSE